jgi:hypothetical protein
VSALILSVRSGAFSVANTWTLLGHYNAKSRTSFFGMVLAVYVAIETFGSHHHRYKVMMCALILISAAYIAKKAWTAKSSVGILTAIFGLIWIAPIVNANVFYDVDLWFMLPHSIFSLAAAVGAFSYLKS